MKQSTSYQSVKFLTSKEVKTLLTEYYSEEITSTTLVQKLIALAFRDIKDRNELEGTVLYITGYDFNTELIDASSSASFLSGLYDIDGDQYKNETEEIEVADAMDEILDSL